MPSRKHKGGRTPKTPWRPSPDQLAIYEAATRGDKTQRQVAKERGCAESWVSTVITKIDRWLVPQYTDKFREIKSNHSQRLMIIYREAMAEWHRSKRPKVSRRKQPDREGKIIAVDTIEGRTGDPRHLQAAMAALEQVRIMWGMNAPEKVEGETTLRIGGMARTRAIELRMIELGEAQKDARRNNSEE
jgi:hypothetical protein